MEGFPYLIVLAISALLFFVISFYVIKAAVKRAIFEARQVINDDESLL